MDLQFLLMLQNFRNGAGSFLIRPMLLVSDLTTYGSAVLCIILYWAVSRSMGYWLMTNVVTGFFVNNVIKLTACIYRPWIRSPLIVPPQNAMESATGYSFPSGHTSAAFAVAWILHLRFGKKVGIPALILAALISFSRLYVGVHYPSDVLGGIFVGTLIAFVVNHCAKRLEERGKI